MMTYETRKTNVSDAIQTLTMAALHRASQTGIFERLTFQKDVPMGSDSVKANYYNRVTKAETVASAGAVTAKKQITVSANTLTIVNNVAQFQLEDIIRAQVTGSLFEEMGMQGADALALQRDDMFQTIGEAFSQTVGASGAVISQAAIDEAVNYIMAENKMLGGIWAVTGSKLIRGAKSIATKVAGVNGNVTISNLNGNPTQEYILDGFISRILGVDWYENTNMVAVGNDMNVIFGAKNCMQWGVQEGFGMHWNTLGDTTTSLQETLFSISEGFGVCEKLGTLGVLGTFDIAD
jgi:hypothetical protein